MEPIKPEHDDDMPKLGQGEEEEAAEQGNDGADNDQNMDVAAPPAAVAAAVAARPDRSESQIRLSYQNPRNFPERLMGALETSTGKDSFWWEEDGTLVAFFPKKVKLWIRDNPQMQLRNYSSLIRNLNRWGFTRVANTQVPDGAIAYRCVLFLRDKTHLIRHMRIDSDVQVVFSEHHRAGTQSRMQQSNLNQQQQLTTASPQRRSGSSNQTSHLTPPVQPPPPPQPPVVAPPQQNQQLLQALASLLQQQAAQAQEAQPVQQSGQIMTSLQHQQQGSANMSLLGMGQSGNDMSSRKPPARETLPVRNVSNLPSEILTLIIDLSRQYLNQPRATAENSPALRTVMQMLVSIVQQNPELLTTSASINVASVQELQPQAVASLLVPPQQQSLPNAQSPFALSGRGMSSQHSLHQDQQQPSQLQNQQPVLPQGLLSVLGRPPAAAASSQAQQPPAGQSTQDNQAGGNDRLMLQLLMLMAQQQQEQQQQQQQQQNQQNQNQSG